MSQPSSSPASLVFIGLGWFPTDPGGNQRYVYELTHSLAAAGDEIELCAVSMPQDAGDTPLKLTNLCEEDTPLRQRLRTAKQSFVQRQIQSADAINVHFPLYGLPLLSKLPKDVPVTLTFHGPWALESMAEGGSVISVLFKKLVEQWVYRKMTRFIVLSQSFGLILHQDYGVPWDKINVIPGGVDTARFAPTQSQSEARQALQWPQDKFILFSPRRLVNRMGLDKLIEAVGQLCPEHPEIWLAIAGKGDLKEQLEQQVKDQGLTDHVKLLGFLPDEDLPAAYQAANLTVIPSQSLEGFGLILLESLACGTPVTCTPIGGMPEAIKAFTPELVMDDIQTEDIVTMLRSILGGKVSLPESDRCRDYVLENFDWKDIGQRVREVLLQPN